MSFVTDALLALRIVSRHGTGRIFVPFVLSTSALAGLATESVAVTAAALMGAFLWVGASARRSPHLRRKIAEERRLRSLPRRP